MPSSSPRLLNRLFGGSDSQAELLRFDISAYLQLWENNWGGLRTPLYPPAVSYAQGQPTERVENSFRGYTYGGYKMSPIVFGCMSRRSSVFSEARFMWRRRVDGVPGELFWNSDLALLEQPWVNGSTQELLTRMIQDVDLAGNCYIVNAGDRLRRLRPDWTQIVLSGNPLVDTDIQIVGYWYSAGSPDSGIGEAFLPDEVCHFKLEPDPIASYRGTSWITPVVREIEADEAAVEHKLKFFENGATLGPIISYPPAITFDQFERFVEKADSRHVGLHNAYRPMYLGGGADVKVTRDSFGQIDFSALQGHSETRICVAAGVPAAIAGVSEGLQGSSLNAGNYAVSRRSFIDGTMRNLWSKVCSALQSILTVPPDAELWYDEPHIAYLHDDQQDVAAIQQTQSTAINVLITAGFEPDSIVDAVVKDDLTLLKHTGLTSVQLSPPGSPGEPSADQVSQEEGDNSGDNPGDEGLDNEGQDNQDNNNEDQSDEDEDENRSALLLDLLDEQVWRAGFEEDAWTAEEVLRAFNEEELRNPKGSAGGGEWRSLASRVEDALKDWGDGKGSEDPLAEFNPRQLRSVAEQRGLNPPKGMKTAALKELILADQRNKVVQARHGAAPTGHRRFSITHGGKRVDVGVSGYPKTGQVYVHRESDSGRRGARVTPNFDSMAELEAWARTHGHSELAAYAAMHPAEQMRPATGAVEAEHTAKAAAHDPIASLPANPNDDDLRAALGSMNLAELKKVARGMNVALPSDLVPATAAMPAYVQPRSIGRDELAAHILAKVTDENTPGREFTTVQQSRRYLAETIKDVASRRPAKAPAEGVRPARDAGKAETLTQQGLRNELDRQGIAVDEGLAVDQALGTVNPQSPESLREHAARIRQGAQTQATLAGMRMGNNAPGSLQHNQGLENQAKAARMRDAADVFEQLAGGAAPAERQYIPGEEDMRDATKGLTMTQLRRVADEVNISVPKGITDREGLLRFLMTTAAEHDNRTGGLGSMSATRRLRDAAESIKAAPKAEAPKSAAELVAGVRGATAAHEVVSVLDRERSKEKLQQVADELGIGYKPQYTANQLKLHIAQEHIYGHTEPAAAKVVADRTDHAATETALRTAPTRDEAAAHLKQHQKTDLQGLAGHMGVPYTSKATKATLASSILDEAGHGEEPGAELTRPVRIGDRVQWAAPGEAAEHGTVVQIGQRKFVRWDEGGREEPLRTVQNSAHVTFHAPAIFDEAGHGEKAPEAPSVGPHIEVAPSIRDLSDLQKVRGENLTSAGRAALESLPASGHPAIAAIPDTEDKIRAAYRMLAIPGGGQDHHVALTDLRKLIGDQASRSDVDDTLKRMALERPDVRLNPQSYARGNMATRIPAAVLLGGQEQNLLHIDDPALARPGQFHFLDIADELDRRSAGTPGNPLMSQLSTPDLRGELDRRAATDPFVAQQLASREAENATTQSEVDRRADVASALAELDQLHHNGASEAAMNHRTGSMQTRHNLEPDVAQRLVEAGNAHNAGDEAAYQRIVTETEHEQAVHPITGPAGSVGEFRPEIHEPPAGATIPVGTRVQVARRGYETHLPNGETLQLAKGQVVEAPHEAHPGMSVGDIMQGREQAEAARQADLKRRTAVAHSLAQLDELTHSGASSRMVENRLRATGERHGTPEDVTQRLVDVGTGANREQIDQVINDLAERHGLTRTTGPAGSVENFDRAVHSNIGGRRSEPKVGAMVTVQRPGYAANIDGEQVQLHKAQVSETSVEELAHQNRLNEAQRLGINTAGLTDEEIDDFIRDRKLAAKAGGVGPKAERAQQPDPADIMRLAGHDTTPGHNYFEHYWTKDPEGLAKWGRQP